jgi:hypothetical protein
MGDRMGSSPIDRTSKKQLSEMKAAFTIFNADMFFSLAD